MAISVESCVVALLGRDDGARNQLHQALEELGASVAFEGEPAGVTDADVLGVSPNVVIVNLDEGADDDLDHLQAVFDNPAINVIFNEASVSRTLEGWDLARWARHLAAKVLGNENTMPPPPEGAELLQSRDLMPTPGAVPTPAQLAPEQSMDAFRDEAFNISGEVPADELPERIELADNEPQYPLVDSGTDLEIDASSLEDALMFDDSPPPERLPPTPELVDEESFGAPTTATLQGAQEEVGYTFEDFDDIQLAELPDAITLDAPQTVPESEEVEGFSVDFGDIAVVENAGQIASELPPAQQAAAPADELDAEFSWAIQERESDLPEAAAQIGNTASETAVAFDAAAWDADADLVSFDEDLMLDDDVAALAAQLDALEPNAPSAEDVPAGLDFSLLVESEDAAGLSEVAAEAEPQPEPAQARDAESLLASLGGLSLTPLEDDQEQDDAAADVAEPAPARASFDFSSVADFSLEPMEGEEAAADESGTDSGQAGIDPLLVAMGLMDSPLESAVDTRTAQAEPTESAKAESSSITLMPVNAAGGIERVIVLGASIGGPDAVRAFLSEFPDEFPALFLLVQHLESGYFERLAQQLQKSSPLPVKVASADSTAAHGEVLVIPASDRVAIDADGRVSFEPHPTPPQYNPSIDAVLHMIADQFGARACAIIFSGMAGDAVEGAAYLAARGGEVWAQDPQSCVVSSMVDGARARGVVEFIGSPRDLAQRCIALFSR